MAKQQSTADATPFRTFCTSVPYAHRMSVPDVGLKPGLSIFMWERSQSLVIEEAIGEVEEYIERQ